MITGAFAVGYGVARIVCEFFREPDPQLGFLWGGLTMGMVLSVPLMLAGIGLHRWWRSGDAPLQRTDGHGQPAAGSRNPPAHLAGRPDAGAAVHGALPRAIPSTATT